MTAVNAQARQFEGRPGSMEMEFQGLMQHLEYLTALHERLVAALDRQLAAARAADVAGMSSAREDVENLVREIAVTEARRRETVKVMAQRLGITDGLTGVTASRLAAHLPEPMRSDLLEAVAGLRRLVEEVQRLNRILAEVSRRVLLHLQAVCESVATIPAGGLYSRDGRLLRSQRPAMFETVG